MIFYSAEARGYARADGAASCCRRWPCSTPWTTGAARWWVLYGVSACLAAYTHYTAVFVPRGPAPLGLVGPPPVAGDRSCSPPASPRCCSHRGSRASRATSTRRRRSSSAPCRPSTAARSAWPSGSGPSGSRPPTSARRCRSTSRDPRCGLPGLPALVLLAASLVVGAVGVVTEAVAAAEGFGAHRGRVGLVVLLTLATPVGTASRAPSAPTSSGPGAWRRRGPTLHWPSPR